MRIVFCGTPDFAVPSLKKLASLAPRHEVAAVVSQPDRPKGRSKTPTPPPVIEAARALGFPKERLFQPRSINQPDVLAALKALAPDVLCVVAYGCILKEAALALPRLMPINAHASLLPKYRGAAPIQAALLAGERETGVSIIKMEAGLDSGPVLFRRIIPIAPDDDAGALHDKLAELSAECFDEAVEQLAAGTHQLEPQDERGVSYAPKLTKDSGRIDWNQDAAYVERFIRAMNPWPGAWTTVATPDGAKRTRLRVVKAVVSEPRPSGSGPLACVDTSVHERGSDNAPSAVSRAVITGQHEGLAFRVGCGTGAVLVQTVQPEGKRAMSAAEFLRGAGQQFQSETVWGFK